MYAADGWSEVWFPVVVLVSVATVLTFVAVLRFDTAETKVPWS